MAKQQGVSYVIAASEYGGPGDPSSGHIGASGVDLTGKMAFAELDMGFSLGHLPMGTKLRIYRRESEETEPKVVIAEKLDIGRGGGPVSGHHRRIDLWYETAKALGFHGLGFVQIERLDGKPIPQLDRLNIRRAPIPHREGEGGPTPEGKHSTVGAGILGTGIGTQTEEEGNEASENFKNAVEAIPGFLGELTLKKVLLALVALGLGAFGLLWLSREITGGTPIPV